jgi:hypothetical protein
MVTMMRRSTDTASDATPRNETADALDQLASRASSEQPEPAAAPATVQADGLENDLLDVLRMVQVVARRGIWWLTPDEFGNLWGDATLQGIAGPGAEIMRRNGWTMADAMSKYGPYIALGAAVAPPAIATVQAYKIARKKPAPAAETGAENGNQAG